MMIEYPKDIEVQQEINTICDLAVEKPPGVLAFVQDMARNLGLKYIFYGTYDAILVSVCVFLIAVFWLGNSILTNPNGEVKIYAVVFSLAPLLFMLLFSLSYWKEREANLYALKMVCKYTVKYLLAFRMLTASVLGFVCTTVYVLILCHIMQTGFVHAMSVAYASLFLFSIIMVQIVLSRESFLPVAVLSAAWVLCNSICFAVSVDIYSLLLRAIPTAIWIAVDTVLAIFLIKKCRLYVRRVCNAYS